MRDFPNNYERARHTIRPTSGKADLRITRRQRQPGSRALFRPGLGDRPAVGNGPVAPSHGTGRSAGVSTSL